jgi:hypothetical protein
VLIRSVIDDQFRDDAQAASMRLFEEALEIVEVAVDRVDGAVVGDVISIVAQRRRVERQQPESGDAEVLEIVELFDQAGKIADAVAVAVHEGPNVDFIKDRVLVPQRVVVEGDDFLFARLTAHGGSLDGLFVNRGKP